MPAQILLPLLFKASGTLVFVLAAMVAGAMNRGYAIVPLLALAGAATQFMAHRIAPPIGAGLQAMLAPDAPKPDPLRLVAASLISGFIGYSIVFGLSAFIAALFQETEFQSALSGFDFGLIAFTALVSGVLMVWSTKRAATKITDMMGDLQSMFGDAQHGSGASGGEEPFTVEGEVIDPDDRQNGPSA